MSGYTLSYGDAVYTCPANGGLATTTLVCEEIECDALVLDEGVEGASASNSTDSTCVAGMVLSAINATSCIVSCSEGYYPTDNETITGSYVCSELGGAPTTTFSCFTDVEPSTSSGDDLMIYAALGGALFLLLIICVTIGIFCRRGKKRGSLKSSNFNSGDAFMGRFEPTQSDFDQNAVCTDIVDTRPSGENSETVSSRNQRAMSEVGLALETDDRRWSMASLRSVGVDKKSGSKSPAALYLQDSSVFSTPRAAVETGSSQDMDPDELMDL